MPNRADVTLLYGDTGSGKTAQLGELARWEFARSGRITRLISADSGWDPIEDLIIREDNPGGCVEAWNIQYLKNPFPVLIELSEGFWPRVTKDAQGKPKIRLIAPKFSPSGGLLGAGDREIGQYAIEGISTIGDTTLQDHIRQQRKIGQDTVGSFSDSVDIEENGKPGSLSLSFAKAAPSHFGQVQDFILLDLVPRMGTLPVSRVLWTGHEAKGDDDVSGIKGSVLGPATVGKAAVNRTARKFGEYLHLTVNNSYVTEKDASGKVTQKLIQDYRAYFVPHPDDMLTKMLWPAKVALSLDRMAELHAKFPGGYIPLTRDVGLVAWMEFKYSTGGTGEVPQTAE